MTPKIYIKGPKYYNEIPVMETAKLSNMAKRFLRSQAGDLALMFYKTL